jgi:hypothetical protein
MPQQYQPVKDQRFFKPDTKYDEINWNDESTVIQQFKEQLEGWYIEPIECLINASPHYGFTVIALTCVLIDTLAQYFAGAEESSENRFKDFFKHYLPDFGKTFPTAIEYSYKGQSRPVEDPADAIYRAFRCGILHEAHVSLYGVVAGHAKLLEYHSAGITRYVDGTDCPTVVIHPQEFFEKIKADVFEAYFTELSDPDPHYANLRDNFKNKFLVSYGIDVGNEP